jgi:hypothetical protein
VDRKRKNVALVTTELTGEEKIKGCYKKDNNLFRHRRDWQFEMI